MNARFSIRQREDEDKLDHEAELMMSEDKQGLLNAI